MAFPESAGPSGPIIARMLLEIGAVHLRPREPFTLTSGRSSPVYIDCRKIISFPLARRRVTELFAQKIEEAVGFAAIDAIAGGETAGIPYAAFLAEKMNLPMLYIRKKPKGFGRNAQIEGEVKDGQRILLIEDLATDGGSKINFIEAIRQAGGKIAHVLVIFHYGIFPQSKALLQEMGVALHGLATWRDIYDVAMEQGLLDREEANSVKSFLENPEDWKA